MVESASEIRMDWRSRHAEAARDARHLCKLESPVQVIIAVMVTLATLFSFGTLAVKTTPLRN
jgi:hypothetical protein